MKKFSVEIKWGIIFTLMTLGWMYLEKLLGWHDEKIEKHAILTNLYAIPATLVYVMALLDKRKNYYSGRINWLQGFVSGVYLSLVIAILSPLSQFLISNYITPNYFQNAIEHAVRAGEYTRLQAERYFTLGNYILHGSIFAIALGAVTSAAVAIFIRKKQ
jgi:hypothetical protein